MHLLVRYCSGTLLLPSLEVSLFARSVLSVIFYAFLSGHPGAGRSALFWGGGFLCAAVWQRGGLKGPASLFGGADSERESNRAHAHAHYGAALPTDRRSLPFNLITLYTFKWTYATDSAVEENICVWVEIMFF